MATIRKMWSCKNSECKNEKGKHRGYKKVQAQGEKKALCKHCGSSMQLSSNHVARITRDGQTISRTISPNKQDAEAYLAACTLARQSGAILPGQERMITWEDAAKIFEEDMQDRILRGKSQQTVDYYRSSMRTLTITFCRKTLQNITEDDVVKFRQERSKTAGNSIVNGNIAILKVLYKLVCKRHKIRQHPRLHEAYQEIFAVERLSKPKRREIILQQEEFETFLKYCKNPILHHFVFGTLNTGLRHGDMLRISGRNIDFEAGTLKAQVKGSKWVTIPLTDGYKAYLKDWLKGQKITDLKNQWVFPNPKKPGDCLNVRSLFDWYGTCKRVAEYYEVMGQKESADKFKSLVPHHLRHTFATHYLYKTSKERGLTVAVFQLSLILGHTTENITKTYLHSLSEEDRSAMTSFGDQMFTSSVAIR